MVGCPARQRRCTLGNPDLTGSGGTPRGAACACAWSAFAGEPSGGPAACAVVAECGTKRMRTAVTAGRTRPARKEGAWPKRCAASQQPRGTLGDLVALAVSDISQLVRYEVDRPAGAQDRRSQARIGAVLFSVAAFIGCLVLMVLSFAYAYGLNAAGIWLWASLLIVAGTYVLLAAVAVLIGFTRFKGLTGLRKTRSTVSGDLALIKRDDIDSVGESAGAR